MINDNKYLVAYFFHPNSNPSMEYVDEFDELPDELEKLDWASEIELVKEVFNQFKPGIDTGQDFQSKHFCIRDSSSEN